MLRKIVYASLLASSAALFNLSAFENAAIVEVNGTQISDAGCYVLDSEGKGQKQFFDTAIIFAANINGTVEEPVLFNNPQVTYILKSGQIAELQKKGIKVMLSYLNNHFPAGWSQLTDPKAAKKLADDMVDVISKYNLDGINIDDEWSSGKPNDTSMIMIAYYIKSNPKFAGKMLSKNLYEDLNIFKASWTPPGSGKPVKLSDLLDCGYEMTYGKADVEARLQPYLDCGMPKSRLGLAVWEDSDSGHIKPKFRSRGLMV